MLPRQHKTVWQFYEKKEYLFTFSYQWQTAAMLFMLNSKKKWNSIYLQHVVSLDFAKLAGY